MCMLVGDTKPLKHQEKPFALLPVKTEVEKKPHILEGEPVAPFSVKAEPSEDKESIILMLEDRNRAQLYELQELRRQLSLAPVKEKGTVTYYLIIWSLKFIQLLYIR